MRSLPWLSSLLCVGALVACGGTTSSGALPDGGTNGVPTTILLQAFGGPSGQVAAQVPLVEPGSGLNETCGASVTAGACQLSSCQVGGIGTPGPGFGNYGPLSASVGTTTMPLTYDGTGYPTVDFPSSVTLGMGGVMTFHGGDGVAIPVFDAPATIPGLALITSPVGAADGSGTVIDSSQDLAVTWVPIAIGQIQFQLESSPWLETNSSNRTGVTVTCAFDGSTGAGVVPNALLASLKTLAAGNATYAELSSQLQTTTVVGDLTIVTQSYQLGSTATATEDSFLVTLQ